MPRFNFHDTVNLLSKLSLRRVWNGVKLLSGFYVGRMMNRPVQWGFPVSLSVEPTTSCNLRCPECPSGLRAFTRPTGMLQPDFFKNTIDEVYRELLYLIFYFQGEPYLNPDFLKMVRYAADKKIYTATSTNAHYLTDALARQTVESGLDRLIISIDGTTQDVYEQYRVGGDLEKVLEGTRRMVEWKKTLGSEWRQYEEIFPKLQKSNIDIISLECHNSRVPMELLELIRGKKVMVGAIDVATNTIETPEEVANTLRKALQFVDADKLCPCTNCGMAPLSRQVALGKLKALSAGADIVRRELLG